MILWSEMSNDRHGIEDMLNNVHIQEDRLSAKIGEINSRISSLRTTI